MVEGSNLRRGNAFEFNFHQSTVEENEKDEHINWLAPTNNASVCGLSCKTMLSSTSGTNLPAKHVLVV